MSSFLDSADSRVIGLGLAAIVILVLLIQLLYLLLPQYKTWQQLESSYSVLQQAAASQLNLEGQLNQTSQEIERLSFELHGDMGDLPANQMESYIVGLKELFIGL